MLKRVRSLSLLLALSLVAMLTLPTVSIAAEPTVNLGTTANFAVLAATTITNTGATTITGDIGVSPGSAIADAGAITLNGTQHLNDAVAIQAQTDLVTAYNDASSRALTGNTGGVELGGLTLGPGVYESGGALGITGTLTLDAGGDPDAVFIFRSTSTLITASDSAVVLTNGARFCRVFWVVPSSATLGTNSTFVGHIFALADIQAQTGATVEGQLLARTGAVTLDNNVITNEICAATRAINIQKTASAALLNAPGPVTFTYVVTNPGTVALSNVVVTDDKVSPVTYVSGDDGDSMLEPGETWRYTATSTITTTTTNTGTVTAVSSQNPALTVTDTASYAVVVGFSTVRGGQLPKTATPWHNLLVASVVVMMLGAVALSITNRRAHA